MNIDDPSFPITYREINNGEVGYSYYTVWILSMARTDLAINILYFNIYGISKCWLLFAFAIVSLSA